METRAIAAPWAQRVSLRSWVLRKSQRAARNVLVVTVFLSPTIFSRDTSDVFNLTKITVLFLGALIALVFWSLWSAERGIWLPNLRLGYAAAAFLLACTVATIFSENPQLSLVGIYHRYGGLIPFIIYALLAAMLVGVFWERPMELRSIAVAAAWAAVVMSAYAWIQQLGLDWVAWKDASGKYPGSPVATMGNSNFAGGYLGLALPYLFYMYFSAAGRNGRISYGLISLAGILALWFTDSRGGLIAAGAALVAVGFVYRERLPKWLKVAAIVGLALILIVVAMLVWHPGMEEAPDALASINVFRTGTLRIRYLYWLTAWRIFLDHPIAGTGLETYVANYPQYRPEEDAAQLGLSITDKPHNVFLEYASNAGILGLSTYLVLIGLGLFYGYRAARKLRGEERLLVATFLGALVGYAGQAFVSIDVPPLAFMGWLGLGGVAAMADPGSIRGREQIAGIEGKMAQREKKKAKNSPNIIAVRVARRMPVAWPVYLAILIAGVAIGVVGIRPYLADTAVKTAQSAASRGAPFDVVMDRYQEAIRTNPLEASYRARVGSIYLDAAQRAQERSDRQRFYDKALDHYRQALDLQPGNLFYIMNIARAYGSKAQTLDPASFEESDSWWKKVIEHDSNNPEVRTRYGLMLGSWAAAKNDDAIWRKAVRQFEIATELKPDSIDGWIQLVRIYRVLGESTKASEALEKATEIDPKHPRLRELAG